MLKPTMIAFFLLMSSWLCTPGIVRAEIPPAGPSFTLASGVSDVGTNFGIAMNQDHFVLVWTDEPLLLARRFAFDGQRLGKLITVDTDNVHSTPAVALQANGDFTIQWRMGDNLYVRSYFADGTPMTPRFVLGETESTDDLLITREGRLIAGYARLDVGDDFIWSLRNAKFERNGNDRTFDSLFSETETLRSRLAGDAEVGFVQLGERLLNGISDVEFSASRLDQDGQPVGSQFLIPALDPEKDIACVADLAVGADGSFVLVWHDREPSTDEYTVFSQTMDMDNLPIGGQRQVNELPAGRRRPCPRIASEPDGTYLVTWTSQSTPPGGNDDSDSNISARRLGPDGSPQGSSFQVNDIISGIQRRPVVLTAPGGRAFLVAWYQEPGTHFLLHARYYSGSIFADGFESGNTSAWSETMP